MYVTTKSFSHFPSAAFFVIAFFSSIPFFVRHSVGGVAAAAIYAALLILLLAAVNVEGWIGVLARSRVLAGGAIIALAVANFAVFPRMRLVAHPSSAPDALSVPFARLLAGREPYGKLLFDGAPISPGPGWIVLHGVFTATGLTPLIVPVWLGLATWMVGKSGAKPALFVALVFAPLAFLQMSVVGHDIFAISLAFIVMLLAAFAVPPQGFGLLALAVFAGTIATARLPLILLPLIIGLGLARRRNAACGIRFAVIATVTAVLWHGGFWLWCLKAGDFYQPLHVFQRAHSGAGIWFTLLGALGGVASWVWIWLKPKSDISDWLFALWLLQTALFLPIGVGELVHAQHSDWSNRQGWADWEGKNYIAYPLPLLAASLVLRF